MDVSPLSREVEPPIRTITARRSLLPSSYSRTVNSVPCGSPATRVTIRACRVPLMRHEWGRPCHSAGGTTSACPECKARQLDHVPIWLKPINCVWLVPDNDVYRQFTCVDHTIQPSPLTALQLAASQSASHEDDQPETSRGYIVRVLQTNPLPEKPYP